MANVLGGLNPASLWEIFEEICKIPHPSKSEEQVREYVVAFARKHGIECKVDEVGNVILRKPATPGMENRRGVILQGHLDMVPQKNNDTVHDFEKDSIKPRIDGEWVKATGTTLGADNGIGVAAAMAVMQAKDIPHGPVECLFTIDEETGMTGAFGLKPGYFNGDILMNLDSEDEGELYIGCAGGINAAATFKYQEVAVPSGNVAYKVILKGAKGGHSGVDIKLGRANANKLLVRYLYHAMSKYNLKIASMDGGSLRNAIPREASAIVTIPANVEDKFKECIKHYESIFKSEFSSLEPELEFFAETAPMPAMVMNDQSMNNILSAAYCCPNGVISMIPDMPEIVQTSNNMAIMKAEKGTAVINCLLRSSAESSKDDLANMVRCAFETAGAVVVFDGSYPGWKPNVNSPILTTMKNIYQNRFGKIPEVKVIHAGLECGLLGGVYPNWDMISFGPTIRFPHSPDEKINIATVQKFWDFLLETLKNVPAKA
jgi:dipeptidase D